MKFGLMYEIQIPEPHYDGIEQERYKQVMAQVELADEVGGLSPSAPSGFALATPSPCCRASTITLSGSPNGRPCSISSAMAGWI